MFCRADHLIDTQTLLCGDPFRSGYDIVVYADRDGPCSLVQFLLGLPAGFRLAVADQPLGTVEELLIRHGTSLILKIIICVYTILAIDRVGNDVVDLRRIKELAGLAFYAVVFAVPLYPCGGISLQDKPVELFYQPDGIFVHHEVRMLLLTDLTAHRGHSSGKLPAGPFTGGAECPHIVGDTLGRVFPFKLCESGENVHDGASHRRGGIEGLLDGHKRDVMLLEDIVHCRKFLHVTADPIQLVDHYNVQNIGAHVRHQILKAGAVHVLAGKSFVLIVDSEINVLVLEDDTGIVLAELYLHVDGVAVIAVYRFSRIDSDCEHDIILLFCTSYGQQGIKMPGACVFTGRMI